MYVPHHFALEDLDEIRSLVRDVHVGQLVTVGPDGVPDATLLPVLWEDDEVVVHLARANEHWRRIADGSPGLVVVTGPDAYITPRWYASKREHGRVVPTWNYSVVQLSGPVTVHDDVDWLREAVTRLTTRHEGRSADGEPWHVGDAPERFVSGQLRAIIGVSLAVTHVEAKAKLSQNRSAEDQAGVVDGLVDSADLGASAVREAMVRIHKGH
ncbi:MAG TPA: FMN-binding negative transcriptional regulator [Lapillicoccus sp.]|nr:FMN-binding negative transcriptional regulator [Lapillicoccus sp.]